jgi:hypothetical protein
LGAEPIDEQLSRLRRVTWTLTGVAAGIGTVIFALFTAFGAPATGAVVAGVLFGPIVALAWFDELKRVSTARAFFRAHPEQSAGAGK